MLLKSKGAVFLVAVAMVLCVFYNVNADFSTYAWFLLFAAAVWIALSARHKARESALALTEQLERECRARVEDIERLAGALAILKSEVDNLPTRSLAAVEAAMAATEPARPLIEPASPASESVESRFVAREVPAAPTAAPPPQRETPQPIVSESTLIPAPLLEPPVEPKFGSANSRKPWVETIRSFLDFEQMLGTNWLSKLGVAVLVLGIAFFLAWQLRELGPVGKIIVGVVVGGILLAAGAWGERFEHYRLLSRAALAGGWPLLFFVSYAAHHVAAARVIASPLIDLTLMMVVVAGMVAHTLRFRSQVVTGLAFLLAFSTVALNRVDVYSLSANVILAIGLSFVAVRMRWFDLEIFGMLAAYLNHVLWLMPVMEHGKVLPFPQFYASAAILLLYWAAFRVSYVVRAVTDEQRSTVAGVLNTVMLLGVMKYQSVHPEFAFWALLALGIVELAFGQFTKARQKRTRFIVLSTIGTALVVAAIPFRYAPDYVAPIWLVQAEVLFFIGVWTNERIFRRLGYAAIAATAIQLFAVQGARVYGARIDGAYVVHHWLLGAIFGAAMLTMYAGATWAPRRWPLLWANAIDKRLATYLTYTAPVMGVLGAWVMFPGAGAAVVWIALATLLAISGARSSIADLTLQANVLAGLALFRALIINLPANDNPILASYAISYRLLTVVAITILMYALSRWNRSEQLEFLRAAPEFATWAASTLASLLIWYELRSVSVAIAWAMFGLILFEVGDVRHSLNLRAQAYVALLAGFLRVFIVNLNAEGREAEIGPRVYTTIPIAIALLYIHQRLFSADQEGYRRERRFKLSPAFAWLGVLCVTALLRFEVNPDLVATAWAASVLLLAALAFAIHRRVFLHIAIALSIATLGRGVLHNLYERSYFPSPGTMDPWLLVSGASALILASLPFAFRLRRLPDDGEGLAPWQLLLHRFDERPEQILFFVPLLLTTLLLATEMSRGMLTVAWGVEAVVVFVFALWVRERTYRLAGLALLLLCVGKIFLLDFWSLGIRDKALTGIILGLALIGVSLLYTNKRDTLRQYL